MILLQLFLGYLFFGLLFVLNNSDFYKQFLQYAKKYNPEDDQNFKYTLEDNIFNRIRFKLIMSSKLHAIFAPVIQTYLFYIVVKK